jgi:hypothetical protein
MNMWSVTYWTHSHDIFAIGDAASCARSKLHVVVKRTAGGISLGSEERVYIESAAPDQFSYCYR